VGDLVEISMGGMIQSARELFYGLVSFIEAGDESPTGEYLVRSTRMAVVVVEMEVEEIPPV
jgi:hypothetical protein